MRILILAGMKKEAFEMLRAIRTEGRLSPPFSSSRFTTSPSPKQENASESSDLKQEKINNLLLNASAFFDQVPKDL